MIFEGLEWLCWDSYVSFQELSAAPGTPEGNQVRVYAKDKSGVSALYYKDDSGTEKDLSGGITGSGAANQIAFWTAATVLSGSTKFQWNDTTGILTINDGGLNGAANFLSGNAANRFSVNVGRTAAEGAFAVAGGVGEFSDIVTAAGEVVLRNATSHLILSARNASGKIKFATGATDTLKMVLDSAGLLGIGQTTPLTAIDVSGADAATAAITIERHGAGFSSFIGYRINGAPAANDGLVLYGGGGSHDGTSANRAATSLIGIYSGEAWTSTAKGSYITLETTPLLSVTRAERFRVGPSGQWGIGGATFGSAGQVFTSGGALAAPTWSTITTTHTILDGTSHTDSVAQTVSRGSLIYGNATPKWDELIVGAANTILGSDGTDVAWRAQSFIDHGSIGGLSDDDHSQYALLAGRSGGQTLNGDTAASGNLIIHSTANATKGKVYLGPTTDGTFYDQATKRLAIGITTDTHSAVLQIGTGTPTVQAQGIQFASDTSAFAFRSGANTITLGSNAKINNNLTVGNIIAANGSGYTIENGFGSGGGIFLIAGPSMELWAGASQPLIRGYFNADTIIQPARTTTTDGLGDVGINAGGSRRMTIRNTTGAIGIGTALTPTGGGPVMAFAQGTTPTGISSNTAGIFAADVSGNCSMHVINENGDVVKFIKTGTYTPSNVSADRSFNANSTTIDELADVLGTLIADLQLTGLIG